MDQNQRLRASPEQFSVLIDFMERHGDLTRPQGGPQGRLQGDRLWGELTCLLNSIGGGVEKSQDKWKKVWADWKTKTKKKFLMIKRHANDTGGGPSSRLTLTAMEERVVSVIGVASVVGLSGVQEHGLNILSQSQLTREVTTEVTPVTEVVIELPYNNIAPPPPLESPLEATQRTSPQRRTPPQTVPRPPAPRRPTPPRRTPPRVNSPAASVGQSPHSVLESPRRRLLRPRRNRGVTPFDRAVTEFVAVENHRLRLEEARDRRQHDLEVERLRLEAQRLDVQREQNQLLRQLAELMQTLSERSLPSTERLSE